VTSYWLCPAVAVYSYEESGAVRKNLSPLSLQMIVFQSSEEYISEALFTCIIIIIIRK
jgi:hypothetical protein